MWKPDISRFWSMLKYHNLSNAISISRKTSTVLTLLLEFCLRSSVSFFIWLMVMWPLECFSSLGVICSLNLDSMIFSKIFDSDVIREWFSATKWSFLVFEINIIMAFLSSLKSAISKTWGKYFGYEYKRGLWKMLELHVHNIIVTGCFAWEDLTYDIPNFFWYN